MEAQLNLLQVIDWEEALNQVGGDEEFLAEVLTDLLNESATSQTEMETGIAASPHDFSTIMKAAHRIKGSASYLCCERLKGVSLRLQDLAHAGVNNPDQRPTLITEIEEGFAYYKQCVLDLTEVISQREATKAAP